MLKMEWSLFDLYFSPTPYYILLSRKIKKGFCLSYRTETLCFLSQLLWFILLTVKPTISFQISAFWARPTDMVIREMDDEFQKRMACATYISIGGTAAWGATEVVHLPINQLFKKFLK